MIGYYLVFARLPQAGNLVIVIWSTVVKPDADHRFILWRIALAAKRPERVVPTMP